MNLLPLPDQAYSFFLPFIGWILVSCILKKRMETTHKISIFWSSFSYPSCGNRKVQNLRVLCPRAITVLFDATSVECGRCVDPPFLWIILYVN
jgi:hypothetical protein